jgi:hypothetical protein
MLIDALAFFQLEEDYTLTDLKDAYRRLAKKYHPDLSGDLPQASQSFIRIRSFYDTLLHHLDPEIPPQERIRRTTEGGLSGESGADLNHNGPSDAKQKVDIRKQSEDVSLKDGQIQMTEEDKLWNRGRRLYEKYLDMMIHTFYVYSRINSLPENSKIRLSEDDEEDIVKQYKYLLQSMSTFSQFKKKYPHSPYIEEVEISLSSMKKVLSGFYTYSTKGRNN